MWSQNEKEDADHEESKNENVQVSDSSYERSDDPMNWSRWRKNGLLIIVALHTMQAPFSASIAIPAFMQMSKEFNVSLDKAAFLVQIRTYNFLGHISSDMDSVFGQNRPTADLSNFDSRFCHMYNVWSILSFLWDSHGDKGDARYTDGQLLAIFISPPLSLGACTVREIFSSEERGEKMGVWSLMVSIGPLLGPILVGFLVQNCGWRAAFDLTAAMQLALFFAHLFFGPETLRHSSTDFQESTPNRRRKFALFQVYRNEPIRFEEFLRPFIIGLRFPTVLLPAFANALVFCHANVFVTVFVPKIFGKKFGLSPGQIGLQIIAQFIGAVLGETLAGRGSDAFVNWRSKKTGNRLPEYRLPLVYPGFLCSIVGLIVWGVQLQNAQTGHWNITPDIGAAITVFGQQIVSSICTTYAIETYLEQTGHVSSFVSFLRQLWGFLGPFYLGDAVDNLGTAEACGVFAVLMASGALMVAICHFFGPRWHPVA